MKFYELKESFIPKEIYFRFSEIGKRDNLIFVELELEIEKPSESAKDYLEKFNSKNIKDFFGESYNKFIEKLEEFRESKNYKIMQLVDKWTILDIKNDDGDLILTLLAHFRIK